MINTNFPSSIPVDIFTQKLYLLKH